MSLNTTKVLTCTLPGGGYKVLEPHTLSLDQTSTTLIALLTQWQGLAHHVEHASSSGESVQVIVFLLLTSPMTRLQPILQRCIRFMVPVMYPGYCHIFQSRVEVMLPSPFLMKPWLVCRILYMAVLLISTHCINRLFKFYAVPDISHNNM